MRNRICIMTLFLSARALLICVGSAYADPVPASVAELFHKPANGLRFDKHIVVSLSATRQQTLISVTFSAPDNERAGRDTTWCGVVFAQKGLPDRGVIAIGKGYTEALSCNGLVDAAAMPSHGSENRVGLIYKTRSPNADSLTPVILVGNPDTNEWHEDDTLTEYLGDNLSEINLGNMKAALSKIRK